MNSNQNLKDVNEKREKIKMEEAPKYHPKRRESKVWT
jgi:hypothetical protein